MTSRRPFTPHVVDGTAYLFTGRHQVASGRRRAVRDAGVRRRPGTPRRLVQTS
ncbi:hypothetical protein ACTWP5_29650 [Streptomyces sp. 4N509B]|uniref:hypothetical protein n=1 Tax=Streptomyces sp. 4N509B TaxID=3457413 RepID=UPI003FD5435D